MQIAIELRSRAACQTSAGKCTQSYNRFDGGRRQEVAVAQHPPFSSFVLPHHPEEIANYSMTNNSVSRCPPPPPPLARITYAIVRITWAVGTWPDPAIARLRANVRCIFKPWARAKSLSKHCITSIMRQRRGVSIIVAQHKQAR